ncbi:trigger factor [Rhodobacteraceae bacterium M385]|nr:trigger factor [Rhodobacteraceae bacterium M385]
MDALKGRWQLSRVITDYRADLTGRFEGEAAWRPIEGGLEQVEQGVLRYGAAAPMQATRRYLWRSQGAELAVFFDDGRPFHTVPEEGKEALHDCPPDTYRVRYSFKGRDAFSTLWRVTGPRKDMLLDTTFTRI